MFIADLGIRVTSDTVKRAEDRLKRFTVAGERAEDAADGVGAGSRRASGGVAMLAKGLGGLIAAVGSVQLASTFVAQGRATSKALAEVSTLIEGTAEQQRDLTAASQDFVRQFGGSVAGQLDGFYTTISAGATSVADATVTMNQANKLAKGGVTDVATAVDGLTSVMNAYGDGVAGAEAVSDAMFVGMRAGKTTIGELSANLGKVAPLAVSAGVGFDELVASIAALTKGGISTAESVTGVRAVLAAVTKPSAEAAKFAKALGLEFNTAAIQSKGFAGFMEDVVAKTGGSNDALATLFGGVEAIIPALAFAGKAGDDFNAILDDMADKAGATDTAVAKVASSMDDRLNQAMARYTVYGDQAGAALLGVLVPALETFNSTIDVVTANSDLLGAAIVGLSATQIPALVTGLGGLVKGMNVAAGAARALGAAMTLAGGPLGIAIGLVASAAAYFLLFRDNGKEAGEGAMAAKTGTEQLNEALADFEAGAPGAAAKARDIAAANRELAQSAFVAAEAELAKMEAWAAAEAEGFKQRNPGLEEGEIPELGDFVTSQLAVGEAQAAVDTARKRLEDAKDRAEGTELILSGGVYGPMPAPPELPKSNAVADVQAILDALKDTAGTASEGKTALDKLADAAKRVFEDTRTPLEKYNLALAELDKMLAADEISEDTYARAVRQLNKELKEAQAGMKEYSNGIQEATASFTDLILGQQSWEEFARASVNRVVREQIEGTLMNALQSLVDTFGGATDSTGGGGGWLASAISTLFGGGKAPSYDGGGDTGSGSRTGGVDGKGGFFGILHPNETVTDHTKGGGTAANVNVPITVVNQNGSRVETRRNSDGGATVRIMDERIEAFMNGPKGRRTMQQGYGVRPNSKG